MLKKMGIVTAIALALFFLWFAHVAIYKYNECLGQCNYGDAKCQKMCIRKGECPKKMNP